jgi:hypothetical protein
MLERHVAQERNYRLSQRAGIARWHEQATTGAQHLAPIADIASDDRHALGHALDHLERRASRHCRGVEHRVDRGLRQCKIGARRLSRHGAKPMQRARKTALVSGAHQRRALIAFTHQQQARLRHADESALESFEQQAHPVSHRAHGSQIQQRRMSTQA